MVKSRVPRILIYSDCPVFGGADALAVHLLEDGAFRERHEASYAYRANPAFDAGVANRLRRPTPILRVRLPDRDEWSAAADARLPRLLRPPAKLLLRLIEYPVFLYALARLTALFRRARPELVHVNDGGYPGALGCRAAAIAAKFAGARKVAFVVHNQARPPRLPWEALDVAIDRLVERCTDAFVTASPIAQASLAARGFPRARMRVIRDGVPTPSGLRNPAEVREELGVREGELALMMLAFFEPRKGHRVLLEALGRLQATRRLPPLKVLLVGNGPELERVRAQAAALGISERVLLLGYRQDASDLLNASDALVLPSIGNEDMPLAILDAMALSKPVVSTRLAGIPDEVDEGVTGLLSEPGDAAGLAGALETLLQDPALRRRLGQAGRKRYEALFSTERFAASYTALYTELLDSAGRSL